MPSTADAGRHGEAVPRPRPATHLAPSRIESPQRPGGAGARQRTPPRPSVERRRAYVPSVAFVTASGLSVIRIPRSGQVGVMSPDEATGIIQDESGTSVLTEISNTMVRLYKDQFGRGPTKARTHWCGDDTIAVVLENTLTPAERNMVKMGEHQRLRDLRTFFQYATVH